MKNVFIKTRRKGAFAIVTALFCATLCLLCFLLPLPSKSSNDGGRYALNAVKAAAYSDPSIEIRRYDVKMTVGQDRKVSVKESVTVKFLKSGLSMFYRMLPKEGTRYYDIQATCAGNADFSYYVADNPHYSDFLDINCVGGAQKGNVWTYELSYVMEEGTGKMQDKFSVDVIGFGWPVALNGVSAEINFPDAPLSTELYVGGYGVENVDTESVAGSLLTSVSPDGKTIRMTADVLKLQYNDTYGERMAAGFTVECAFDDGVLANYATTRIFTKDMLWILLVGLLCVAGALGIYFCTRKKREIVTIVNVAAPDEMDPMKMGKWLDGNVDSEDVTSMIYYFADKGYLEIDLSDENDPVLIKTNELPVDAPIYAKTLFNGLFKKGDRVATSALAHKYYESAEIAKRQIPTPTMYEAKSILGFVLGGILGALYASLVPLIMSVKNVGGGYRYFSGFIVFVPMFAILLFAFVSENYRYKWKRSRRTLLFGLQIFIAAVATLGSIFLLASHIMTGYEIAVMDICCFAATFICTRAISRKEKYVKELGDILGFKDFIVYTEEDKIKFMLEENPQLYYKVLPYAQVLGVTDEWEGKFANILLEPPAWCVGTHMTAFDYIILHRCMTRAMSTAMQPPQSSSGGISGGGGRFGGFGGGGFGGGGGGAR